MRSYSMMKKCNLIRVLGKVNPSGSRSRSGMVYEVRQGSSFAGAGLEAELAGGRGGRQRSRARPELLGRRGGGAGAARCGDDWAMVGDWRAAEVPRRRGGGGVGDRTTTAARRGCSGCGGPLGRKKTGPGRRRRGPALGPGGPAAMWARLPMWRHTVGPGGAADVSGAYGRCPARGEEGELGFWGGRSKNFGKELYL